MAISPWPAPATRTIWPRRISFVSRVGATPSSWKAIGRESLTARILRTRWHEYSPPSVLHWFNPDNLSRFAAERGFDEIERGRPAKFISGAHAKSLSRFTLQDLPAGKVMGRIVDLVPDRWRIRYPAEDLFWMLLKKQ